MNKPELLHSQSWVRSLQFSVERNLFHQYESSMQSITSIEKIIKIYKLLAEVPGIAKVNIIVHNHSYSRRLPHFILNYEFSWSARRYPWNFDFFVCVFHPVSTEWFPQKISAIWSSRLASCRLYVWRAFFVV